MNKIKVRIRFRLVAIGLLVLCMVLLRVVQAQTKATTLRVLSLAWLSTDGILTRNEDIYSSYMMVPIAIKHFNDRNGSIIEEFANLKDCKMKLELVNGKLHDDHGQANIAMTALVRALYMNRVDIIHGPGRSDVSSSFKTISHPSLTSTMTNATR